MHAALAQCGNYGILVSLFFGRKFRESNGFTKQVCKTLNQFTHERASGSLASGFLKHWSHYFTSSKLKFTLRAAWLVFFWPFSRPLWTPPCVFRLRGLQNLVKLGSIASNFERYLNVFVSFTTHLGITFPSTDLTIIRPFWTSYFSFTDFTWNLPNRETLWAKLFRRRAFYKLT